MINTEKTTSQMKQELVSILKQLNQKIDTYSRHYAKGQANNVKKILGATNKLIGHRFVIRNLKDRIEQMKNLPEGLRVEIKQAYENAKNDLMTSDVVINA